MRALLILISLLFLASCSSVNSEKMNAAEQQLQGKWIHESSQLGFEFEGHQVREIEQGRLVSTSDFHVETNDFGEEMLIITDEHRTQRLHLQRTINRMVLNSKRELMLRRAHN